MNLRDNAVYKMAVINNIQIMSDVIDCYVSFEELDQMTIDELEQRRNDLIFQYNKVIKHVKNKV